MAGRRRLERKTDDRRPVVTDDFIYDDPRQTSDEEESGPVASDTPEEAVRKLRKRTLNDGEESAAVSGAVDSVSEDMPSKEKNKAAPAECISGRFFAYIVSLRCARMRNGPGFLGSGTQRNR